MEGNGGTVFTEFQTVHHLLLENHFDVPSATPSDNPSKSPSNAPSNTPSDSPVSFFFPYLLLVQIVYVN